MRINDLIINQEAYFESLKYNLFFNRKVFIDNDGNIKTNSLSKVVHSIKFNKLWKVNKDKVAVCKDCEFRYICPDNRIPIQGKK